MLGRPQFVTTKKTSEPISSRRSKSETGGGALNPVWHSLATRIQPKLKVTQAGDGYEQEANRVADQILTAPAPRVQRMCSECEEEEVQRKVATGAQAATTRVSDAPADIAQAVQGGQPLPKPVRAFFEPRFGADLSQVRISSGMEAEKASSGIHARAFTLGNNIVFGKGEYAPETFDGKRLLAHELTHTLQQREEPSAAPSIQRKPQRTTEEPETVKIGVIDRILLGHDLHRENKLHLAPRRSESDDTSRKGSGHHRGVRGRGFFD